MRLELIALAAGAVLLGLYVIQRAADAAAEPEPYMRPVTLADGGDIEIDYSSSDGETALDYLNPFGAIARQVESSQVRQATQSGNVAAFLTMLATAEGTERAADPYRVCFGYRHAIRDLSEHPAVSGEWGGSD